MPSANMRTTNNNTSATVAVNPMKGSEFNISSKDVEGLVLEIKENLRVSAGTMNMSMSMNMNMNMSTMKALPCSHLSRKPSRASPYRVPGKVCSCDNLCESSCLRKLRRKPVQDQAEDPYELLQRLLRDGNLVNEAVRRVQLGLTPKQRYFYESDEETSPSPVPVLHLCPQEN